MKKIITILALLLFSCSIFATPKVLNLYMWADYMPMSVIQQFEHETGIKVNVSEYDSNATLYAKLKAAPNAGYDVIIPSSYFVDRMHQEGMLHKLDKSKLPNMKYLLPNLLNKAFDPHNNYSLPYFWGTTGLVVNKNYFDVKKFNNWQDLWRPQYKNQLLILNDMREAFAMALITLGYSINDTNPAHIKQAYLKLRQLLPNIRVFNSDAEQSIYIDGDITLGMGWNGDVFMSQQENKNLVYIYPKDGFSVWIDCLAIAKNAPHLANAYKFIDFLMRPNITKEIVMGVGYSSPNWAATKLLPKSLQNNPVMNPPARVLKRGQFQQYLGPAVVIYAKYWQLLKIGS